ncbi:hypothetical protein D1872_51060 [compost metagenome]
MNMTPRQEEIANKIRSLYPVSAHHTNILTQLVESCKSVPVVLEDLMYILNNSLHVLKIRRNYFYEVEAGTKTFEVRRKDRDYAEGDRLILAVWNDELQTYTGEFLRKTITYVLDDPEFCKEGYVILGLGD